MPLAMSAHGNRLQYNNPGQFTAALLYFQDSGILFNFGLMFIFLDVIYVYHSFLNRSSKYSQLIAMTKLQYNDLEHPWPSKLCPVSDFSYHSWTHEVSNKITERILSLFLEPSLFNWKQKYHIEILCDVSCCRKTEMETQGQVGERTLKFTEGE